jgi:hypothetical protein
MLFLDTIFSHIKKVLLTFIKIMNKQQILKKIGEIIHDLDQQHQYLSNINKINILELELFTANADFLIDHLEILKKIEANALLLNAEENLSQLKSVDKEIVDNVKVETVKEEQEISKIEDEPKRKFFDFSLDEEPTEMVFDFERKISVEEVFDRALSDEEKEFLEQKQNIQEVQIGDTIKELQEEEEDVSLEEEEGPEPFLISEKIVEEQPIALPEPEISVFQKEEIKSVEPIAPILETAISKVDQVTEPDKKLTLNEMLSNKLGNKASSTGHITQKQITDLKSAISLNDKMVFIKELFNGYNLAYSEAIEIINRFDNYEAADNFLQKNYSVKNDWESKKATVERLYDYLSRRFKA